MNKMGKWFGGTKRLVGAGGRKKQQIQENFFPEKKSISNPKISSILITSPPHTFPSQSPIHIPIPRKPTTRHSLFHPIYYYKITPTTKKGF
jgi:hypothetical protein